MKRQESEYVHVCKQARGKGMHTNVAIYKHFSTIAHLGKPLHGYVPPELRRLWNKVEEEGVVLQLLERREGGEQEVPDVSPASHVG